MKLMRYGPPGNERAAMLDAQGRMRDASSIVADLEAAGLMESMQRLRAVDAASLPIVEGNPRIGPPVRGRDRRPARSSSPPAVASSSIR